ncbi:MAG: hypothetical protein BGO55_09245 [Sphingobacteriales bacterium 50-39]|nr:hypothetical protein [Sphingobacteriales bacterium]OJW57731.1 MAG: hypothetical protein BGO55_09245 [Sphingobacteriales bacterium 50-39]
MNKLIVIFLSLVIVLMLISLVIPAKQIRSVTVANTLSNSVAALHRPRSWRTLDSGRNTHINELGFMRWTISEPVNDKDSTEFAISLAPDLSPKQDPQHSTISYVHMTSLFYALFPSLEKPGIDVRTVDELRSYLQDNLRFYGYPIRTQKLVDSFFLTRQANLRSGDLFKALPGIFQTLETYASRESGKIIARNIAITPLDHDSITLMAGLNIDKSIYGDEVFNFRQLPSTLGLVVGRFEGRFSERNRLYAAMEKFISDHELAKRGLPYERYQSPLPGSDSSMIRIDLIYPVSYR